MTKTTYTKLDRDQVLEMIELAKKQISVPQIAKQMGVRISTVINNMYKENCSHLIKFIDYGVLKKEYRDDKELFKNKLLELFNKGMNDDDIAKEVGTNYLYISRMRSTLGIVHFNRISVKGHRSKHYNKHIIKNKNQQSLFDNISDSPNSSIKQTVIQTEDGPILFQEKDNIEVVVENNSLNQEEIGRFRSKLSWRAVCKRMSTPSNLFRLYSTKGLSMFFLELVHSDPFNNLVIVRVKFTTPITREQKEGIKVIS